MKQFPFLCLALSALLYVVSGQSPECSVYVYTDLQSVPSVTNDRTGTCPLGGGARGYLLDTPPEARGAPQLKEIAPDLDEVFGCLPDRTCKFVVTGFGLDRRDSVVVLKGDVPCSVEEEAEPLKVIQGPVSADTTLTSLRSAVFVLDRDIQQYTQRDVYTVFDLGTEHNLSLEADYTICYASWFSSGGALSRGPIKSTGEDDNSSEAEYDMKQFYHKAGLLKLSDVLFHCDFEGDGEPLPPDLTEAEGGHMYPHLVGAQRKHMCGMNVYVDHKLDLRWRVHSGETFTPGTGPAHDTTKGRGAPGHYLLMEPPGFLPGAQAVVVSPPLSLPVGVYCLSFDVHMHGEDVNSLLTYFTPLGDEVTGDWGSPRFHAVGGRKDEWTRAGFEIQSNGVDVMRAIFVGVAGNSEQGDLGLDEIKVASGRCSDDLLGFDENEGLVCGEARLITGKWASDKSWQLSNAVGCSGRGYSFDGLANGWVPCCLPRLGEYKVTLLDQFGDGWDGSELELRFFGRVFKFGDDFVDQGSEKEYHLSLGYFTPERYDATEDSITVSARVHQIGSYVWCGATSHVAKVVENQDQAGNTRVRRRGGAPTVEVLKMYGVRSAKATSVANEEVTVVIENGPGAPLLAPLTEYDVYCYSEVSGGGDDKDLMDDEMVRSSRVTVTTDSTPPEILLKGAGAAFFDANITLVMNEAGTVWCLPIESTLQAPSPSSSTIKAGGYKTIVRPEDVGREIDVNIHDLTPTSEYSIYCTAQDNSLPHANVMSDDKVKENMVSIKTIAKIPTVSIASFKTFANGFTVSTRADAPGKVWCAAAPAGYQYPTVEEVMNVGAHSNITDVKKVIEVEIRGVPKNAKYTVFCLGANGRGETNTAHEMWQTGTTVHSFGKFCDIPATPKTLTEVQLKSPFDPLTHAEEFEARDFMMARKELMLEGVYRINLLPNKTEIYGYYDHNAPLPLRYARVRVGRCINDEGWYEQYKVGPLGLGDGGGDTGTATAGGAGRRKRNSENELSYVLIGEPVKTECGGYNPEGVFGRRRRMSDSVRGLQMDEHDEHDEFNELIEKSFGVTLRGSGSQACSTDYLWGSSDALPAAQSGDPVSSALPCATLGPIIVEENEAEGGEDDVRTIRSLFIGLKTPEGDFVPFYFVVSGAGMSEVTPATGESGGPQVNVDEILKNFHLADVEGYWYNGKQFPTLDDLISDYKATPEADRMTPAKTEAGRTARRLNQMRQAMGATNHHRQTNRYNQRRLQPYQGPPGTAAPLIDHSEMADRGGLEYRTPPEHVEPQGPRYTVEAHPGNDAYTIDYNGWRMTVTNDRDTSLRIWNIMYQGRRVAYEVGLMEALAHYSTAERNYYFLDSWYGGLGAASRKIQPGIECAKTATLLFWDKSLCVFEHDEGRPIRSHWKSGQLRDAAPSFSLKLLQMLTVSNYDYVAEYTFHLSGFFEGSVSFTGELYAGVEVPWFSARQANYGTQVTGAMRMGALHNHFVTWKIDFDIDGDGQDNSVHLADVRPDPIRFGAHMLVRSFPETEKEANSQRGMYHVVNEDVNIYGNVGGYMLKAAKSIDIEVNNLAHVAHRAHLAHSLT
eukprot:GHVN01059999.1.p1 GENE.GHVN01059999.1~~GHVN01059999.1.p1  ORF type:complete len:1579 (+),score=321.46 GHVN01059999.1:90-4826(+)